MISTDLGRGRALRLCLVACVLASGCEAASLSPRQIDEAHALCQQHIASVGRQPLERSENVGFRLPADPPGTPVVIYGASWCTACRMAASYMARVHIPFVERDVERDAAARAQARATLIAAGLPDEVHSLPVIDVRGTVFSGRFDSCAVERAWASP